MTPTKCDTPNSRKPDIECEICKHKFINSNNLTKHIEKYHENKENKSTNSYKCDHCSLTFKEKTKLTIHMKSHHSMCTICKRTFSRTNLLF